MKVIQIEHDRCNEPDKYRYYFVPDEMTVEQIQEAINAAQATYLKHLGEMDGMFPEPESPKQDFRYLPDEMTMGELKAQVAAYEQASKELREKRSTVENSFSDVLKTFGIKVSTDVPEELEFTADWGHRHGKRLRY